MSLTTRCPTCGTMFKVVADQLKVSSGWVRCGHCTEIFDALLYFQTPPPIGTKAGAFSRERAPLAGDSPSALSEDTVNLALESIPTPLAVNEADDARCLSESSESNISFVRDAKKRAFWRKPLVRFALSSLSFLLVISLLLQFFVQQRDSLSASIPQLTPWLNALCQPLGCSITPMRHIESFVVDSSSLNKINETVYQLSFSLKNTGTISLAMPSLELTLIDAQEHALIRRVMLPAQLGAAENSSLLASGGEFSGVVVMQVANTDIQSSVDLPQPVIPLRVAGYRVLAFYP